MIVIALEGPDGMGKSTQAQKLENRLRAEGYTVYTQHFPRYEKPIGNLIGQILKGEHPMPKFEAMQMLYAADQTDFANDLKELEDKGYDYVILDRYSLSTLVYYTSKINDVNKFPTVYGWQTAIVKPDITLVLSNDEIITDKCKYKELDEFEKDRTFMARINKNYLHFARILSHTSTIEVVHANGTVDEVHKRISNKLKKHKIIKNFGGK